MKTVNYPGGIGNQHLVIVIAWIPQAFKKFEKSKQITIMSDQQLSSRVLLASQIRSQLPT